MTNLSDLDGTTWTGTSELWLDPLGNDGAQSPCTLAIDGAVLRYTWTHEGKEHRGAITLLDEGAEFVDSFHQPEPVHCRRAPDARGIFQVQYRYGPDQDWAWRIGLGLRSPTELVLQMTNMAPWGEEGRAVRMICLRDG